jgi:N-carbamoyl-L-amino-acid hydrolase
MRIDRDRMLESIDRLAAVGATPGGGVTRLALSDEDRQGRELVGRLMEEAGLRVRIDDLGNMTGRRDGSGDQPAVVLGSHCDSVRRGGRYDGAYGVLAAIEVARRLNDLAVTTRRPIEVVNWTNEEGVRFEPAMMCSGVVAGRFGRAYVYDRRDLEGKRFEEELRRIGYLGSEGDRPGPAAAYLELHIEQGPVLEAADLAVGVVQGIVGITWSEVTVEGRADHAGPSPMELRRDALAAAAQVISAVEQLARRTPEAVATVGRLTVEPNVINTIPGRVVMSVDVRHGEPATLEALVAELEQVIAALADERGVGIALDRFWTSEATPFAPSVVAAVEDACRELALPSRRLWSGAGHDAKYMAEVCPTAMIFVRSRGGLSHCEEEFSTAEDLAEGADVLLNAAWRLADRAG